MPFLQIIKGLIYNHFGQQSITHLWNCPSYTVCNLSLEKIDDIRNKYGDDTISFADRLDKKKVINEREKANWANDKSNVSYVAAKYLP